jgi:tetratricopeptide (TPR) repeat protein
VIEMPGAPGDLKAKALFNRGATSGKLGDMQAALADHSAVIGMTDASVDLKAMAIINRGIVYGKLGDTQAELADFAAVIEMPGAPGDLKAKALFNRGATSGKLGDTHAALANYTALIEMPDAPGELKAKALVIRGLRQYRNRNWQASENDFEASLAVPDGSSDVRTQAMFALPEPMVAVRPLQEVVAALVRAFEKGDKQSDDYGGSPDDLLSMILERGPSEWADYISAIVPLYVRHGVAEKLGQGVTRSIRFHDEGDFSSSQLELWNQAWQQAGKDCEDLQIPLACLDAAVEVLKSEPPNDRPLFRLPLEVRQLVRPLLRKTLRGD